MKKSGGLDLRFLAIAGDLSANNRPSKISRTINMKYVMTHLSLCIKLIVNNFYTRQMTNRYFTEYSKSYFILKTVIMLLIWNNYCRMHN